MTVEEIAKKIENPELCTVADVQELERLISKYPYAQSFPVLLLQTLGKTKSINFEEALNKHAFRISDRAHLYQLINADEKVSLESKDIKIETPVIDIKIPIAELEETSTEVVSEEIVSPEVEEIHIASNALNEKVTESKEEITVPEFKTEVPSSDNVDREEIELTKDNTNFDTFEVQEMSFEPVQVDFDTIDTTPIDFDEIPETIVPIKIVEEEEKEEPIEEVAEETTEEIIKEAFELDDVDVPQEVLAIEVDDIEISTSEIEIQESVTEEDVDQETEMISISDKIDASESKVTEEKEIQPLSFFDPTVDLLEENEVDTIVIDEVKASEFDKEVSLELIEKSDIPEDDELTSHAIAEGFHLTLEEGIENAPIEDLETVTTENSSEIVTEFEQKLADDKRSFLDWLKVSATTQSQEYQVKQRASEILDKFIEEDPKITRISKDDEPEKKAAEFFRVSKIAKASLNEKEIPVSETLAEIFEAQGNISKAINCYEVLILLNPEKKSFFANRIKKLKKIK